MYRYLEKSIVLFTLLCFFNMTMGYCHEIPTEFLNNEKDTTYLQDVEVLDRTVNSKFKISWSILLAPYYIGKMCIYAYRFKKLKKDDIRKHVKLGKKCKKCAKRLGFKIKVGDYIDHTCWSLEEETGYPLVSVNKDLRKRFGCKIRRID